MNAKMVNFGGWDMPVEYSGIIAEHMATRTAAGLFDVSHMGEIEIRRTGVGSGATCHLQRCAAGDRPGPYSGLMSAQGTFVDDLLVHKISDTHYFLCVNAANQDGDFEHIRSHNRAAHPSKTRVSGTRSSPYKAQGSRDSTASHKGPLMHPLLPLCLRSRWTVVVRLIARTATREKTASRFYFSPGHSEKLWFDLLELARVRA